RLLGSGLTRREKVAWSFAAGLLLQTICLLALMAAGTRPTGGKILLLEIVAGSATAIVVRPGRSPALAPARSWLLVVLLTCVAGAAWFVFLAGSLADSMWSTDFLAFWGYKGKIVFLTGGIPERLFSDPALYFAHPEYPLLVQLTLAALASFLGRWNDLAL